MAASLRATAGTSMGSTGDASSRQPRGHQRGTLNAALPVNRIAQQSRRLRPSTGPIDVPMSTNTLGLWTFSNTARMRIEHSWFNDLPVESQRSLRAASRLRRFSKGQFVYHEGELGDTLHLIERGHVAIKVQASFGEEVTLDVLGPGDTFGYHALIADNLRRTTSAVSLGSLETLALFGSDFAALRAASPGIDAFLVRLLLDQVQHVSRMLVESRSFDAETRVFRRLAELSTRFPDDGGAVVIPITQDDLAGLAGTTRPTTNRVLQEAVRRGAIVLGRGRITLLDLDDIERSARS